MPQTSTLLYVAWTAAFFLIFFVTTFPYELVARRAIDEMLADSDWSVRYDRAHLVPWDGIRFSDLRVIAPGSEGEPWIRAANVSLRPSLLALFGSGLSRATFHGRAYGGTFSGAVARGGTSTFDLSWSDLQLAAHPRLATLLEGTWAGGLSGQLRLEIKNTPAAEGAADAGAQRFEGAGKLVLRNASLTQAKSQGITIPDLHSTQGEGNFDLRGTLENRNGKLTITEGRLDIRTLKLAGSEVETELRGALLPRLPLADTIVNVSVSVKPVPGTPPGVEGLLLLLNRNQKPPSGVYTFALAGTLRQVRVPGFGPRP